MERSMKEQIRRFTGKRKRTKARKKILTVLAAIVVFCTTYALILPAITQVAEPTCGLLSHTHTEACYTQPPAELVCDLVVHTHEESCFDSDGVLICPYADFVIHLHDALCYDSEGELVCMLPEIEPHSHDESCYEDTAEDEPVTEAEPVEEETAEEVVEEEAFEEAIAEEPVPEEDIEEETAEESSEEPAQEPVEAAEEQTAPAQLICQQEEYILHTHEETCFDADGTWLCGIPELQEHIHTDDCIEQEEPELICTMEEHEHDAVLCFVEQQSETQEIWEQTLPPSTGDPIEDLLLVAQSQLGYTEDTAQVQTDSDDIIRGQSRYGIWYGDPYGPWDTTFLSFCIHYAGISEELVPRENNAYRMSMNFAQRGLFAGCEVDYLPNPGDVVFFDRNGDGNADRAALVVLAQDGSLMTIEGDTTADTVEETRYELSDAQIVGYGTLTEALGAAPVLMMSAAPRAAQVVAQTVAYDSSLFTSGNCFVMYTQSNGQYYAFDGNGNAVEVFLDSGNIVADVDDPDTILWSLTRDSGDSYLIQNVSTGRYMHAYPNNGSGVTTSGAYPSTLIASGSGVKVRSNSEYARLNTSSMRFEMTQNQSLAAIYSFGMTSRSTIWLDGTNGGLMSLNGAANESFDVVTGSTFILPETWQSTPKYDYTLLGWYDVINSVYYAPGTEVTVTDNMVFYADWVASTYDIGQFNAQVADTVSTNEFITVRMFDYGPLFNVLSSSASVNASASSHSETWSLITSGNNPYNGEPTLNYIFRDWDQGNQDISYPRNHNAQNNPTNAGSVYSGLYTERLGELLFDPDNSFNPETGEGVIGKQYVGTGDYLFKLMEDPNDEHYGYYYYDSAHNAASYNQSENRFYVYEYLECTSDSAGASEGKYSDFLPFNSPYANTGSGTVNTYEYVGDFEEYEGTDHYMYDAKYNSNGSAADHVQTNYWFGMSVDLQFYLPETPGQRDADGNYGNQDIYGKDMHFKFTGDDDVWVFMDGELVLDLGGIHGMESGDINFATGVVTVNGVQTSTLSGVAAGEHTLTVYYLERGASLSNCALYFNLAPRFSFSIEKEDVLTKEVLNGAEFSVFEDLECTIPANLWESKEDHDNGEPATNVFTVKNGAAHMWGMGAGNTYYIKETKPPDAAEYTYAHGIICVSIDKKGTATYNVILTEEINPDGSTTDISGGFTVHGFRIDKETQSAYIVATNAPKWVDEVTTVAAQKVWNDSLDHSGETISVYLTITDPDGTVRRLQEAELGADNDWKHTWQNLPKYEQDGVTEIQYGVEEAYVPGYYSSVGQVTEFETTTTVWQQANSFVNGKTYLLQTSNGCLAASSDSTTSNLQWVGTEAAKSDPLALWTATVSGSTVKFTNGAGQVLNFNYGTLSSSRYFNATKNSGSYQSMTCTAAGSGFRIGAKRSNRTYYMSSLGSNGRMSTTTTTGSAMTFTLLTMTQTTTTEPVDGLAYRITNTPLDKETSMRVYKNWDMGELGTADMYEREQVTIRLLANGKDTGRTITLNLKNSWTDIFQGLPYADEDGSEIVYTIEEVWENVDYIPTYGTITRYGGDPVSYEITVVNTYRWGHVQALPATGGSGTTLYTAAGLGLLLAAAGALMYSHRKRRKEEGFSPGSEN